MATTASNKRNIDAAWEKATSQSSTEEIARVMSGAEKKDWRGVDILGIFLFKERKDDKKPWNMHVLVIDSDKALEHFGGRKKEKIAHEKELEMFPVTTGATCRVGFFRKITVKLFPPVNPDLEPGTVVTLRAAKYRLYRKTKEDNLNFSNEVADVVPVPGLFVKQKIEELVLSKRVFDTSIDVDTYLEDMKKIVGDVQRVVSSDKGEYFPPRGYVFRIDPKANISARLAEGTPTAHGKITAFPIDATGYKRKKKDETEMMALTLQEGQTPLAAMVAFGTSADDMKLVRMLFRLYEEDLSRIQITDLKDWVDLGPVLVPGLTFDYVGYDDAKGTAALPAFEVGDFHAQHALKGMAVIDLAATIQNVGIPVSVERVGELMKDPKMGKKSGRAFLEGEMRSDNTAPLSLGRDVFAVNLDRLNDSVKRMLKAAETGQVKFYLVCNHKLGAETLSELQNGATDDQIALAIKQIRKDAKDAAGNIKLTWTVYAVSSDKPIKEYVGDVEEAAPTDDAGSVLATVESDDVVPPPAKKQKS